MSTDNKRPMPDALDTDKLRELEAAATKAPWRAHWHADKPGKPERLREIAVPVPGQKFGSQAIVASPAWTERNGEMWDAWLAIDRPDADLIIALRNAAPSLLDAFAALRAENAALREQVNDVIVCGSCPDCVRNARRVLGIEEVRAALPAADRRAENDKHE